MGKKSMSIEAVLGPQGLLARSLPGFEFRSSQLQMAREIENALRERISAIVEAGTGTGKTFGYLVPLILGDRKAVVSTGTKNLQEQIYFKDLPLLSETTGLKIDATIMKGRKNYLCRQRYHQVFAQATLADKALEERRRLMEAWIPKTRFADRAELSWLADDDTLWDYLSSSSEQCLGSNCLFMEECFLNRLRRRAAQSKLIIVNHHLFFADMKVKQGGFGEIIPRFQAAVFDEAHNIEETATAYFGETLSTRQLNELVGDLKKEVQRRRGAGKSRLQKHLNAIRNATANLRNLFETTDAKGRLDKETIARIAQGPGRDIAKGLQYIAGNPGLREAERPEIQGLALRAEELGILLENILKERESGWLNWYEKRKHSLALHASPLNVAGQLQKLLYSKVRSAVFTSATLSTNGNFDYIRARLGIPADTAEGLFPSHFNYRANTLLYLPKDLPPPTAQHFGSAAAERILQILRETAGRALVLFTSYHNLHVVHRYLRGKLPYSVFRQGDKPRSIMLDHFRRDIHSVLLATGSFWQGVDVPGESLSCLIVDKLPFDSPGEPLVAARIDAIREEGGNPFLEYQVPSAIISLKQGLGRLIRKASDRGMLSVLDIRLLTSRYGRLFLNSLPPIPVSHDLNDIRRFFDDSKGGCSDSQAVGDNLY
jgi:ATP-dependent DNA helicase DinG